MAILEGSKVPDVVDQPVITGRIVNNDPQDSRTPLPICFYSTSHIEVDNLVPIFEPSVTEAQYFIPSNPASYVKLTNTLPIPESENIKDGIKRGVKSVIRTIKYG